MSVGKSASQSGHAFIGAYLQAEKTRQEEYHQDGIGTKICLAVKSLEKLRMVYDQAREKGIPCVLIEDSGNNTCFNGVPTITAVGIGPIRKHEFPELRKIPLKK